MKRLVLIIFVFSFLNTFIYANDTYLYSETNGTIYTNTNDSVIKLLNEEITITLFDDGFKLNANMFFLNTGKEKIIPVGFPMFSLSSNKPNRIEELRDYKTSVNDKDTEFVKVTTNKLEKQGIYGFYLKQVSFKYNQVTKTSFEYFSDYSDLGHWGNVVPYVFGTGISWGKRPWNIRIGIVNKSKYVIDHIRIVDKDIYKIDEYKPTIDNKNETTIISLTEVMPKTINARIEIWTYPFIWNIDDLENTYLKILPDADDLKYLTKEQLELIRNSIYAKKGCKFKADSIYSYFKQFDWYSPNENNGNYDLSELEEKIQDLIISEEKKRT